MTASRICRKYIMENQEDTIAQEFATRQHCD